MSYLAVSLFGLKVSGSLLAVAVVIVAVAVVGLWFLSRRMR